MSDSSLTVRDHSVVWLMLRRFARLRVVDMCFDALILALLLYALAGTPTPDSPGAVECILAFLLLFVVWPGGLFVLSAAPGWTAERWVQAARAVLWFGLSVPVCAALVQGNAPGLMMRDMIWLGFVLLPLFLLPLWQRYGDERTAERLFRAAVAAGFLLSLREFLRLSGMSMEGLMEAPALAYLGNSPLVLMAAIALACFGSLGMIAPQGRRGHLGRLVGGALLVASLLPLIVMMAGMQRAFIGGFAVALAVFWAALFRTMPYRMILFLCPLIGGMIFFLWPEILFVRDLVSEKTHLVGLNRRAEEWAAVWHHITETPLRLLFGTGWGGVYDSPAVGGMSVNFTHGALSFVLLKTGLCGLAVFFVYFCALAVRSVQVMVRPRDFYCFALSLALLIPFGIDILLYASFKSLDFGILLWLICLLPETEADKNVADLASADKSH